MSDRLPSLSALRAFEAAARHLSLTRAAEELFVTPAAISHQIKALEEYLGFRLFDRTGRRLALTEEARAGLAELRRGFDLLGEGVRRIRASRSSPMLRISSEPTFAGMWLVPRLAAFRRNHPDLDVLIDASDRLADFERDPIDVGIRWGGGRYPGLASVRLFDEQIFPVCHPRLQQGEHPLRGVDDIAFHTLIHLDWPKERGDWPHWRQWLAEAGGQTALADRGLHFTAQSDCLRAAVEGQGVALASDSLVVDDLRSGRLVRPFAHALDTDLQMFLVCRQDRQDEPAITAFRDWVVAAAAETLPPRVSVPPRSA